MVIVNMKIDPPAAELAEVAHSIRPIRRTDHSTKMSTFERSEFARLNCVGRVLKFGEVRENVSDKQRHASGFGSLHHFFRFALRNSDWFFNQSRFASGDGIHHDLVVLVGGQADINKVDVRIGKQLMVVGVSLDVR